MSFVAMMAQSRMVEAGANAVVEAYQADSRFIDWNEWCELVDHVGESDSWLINPRSGGWIAIDDEIEDALQSGTMHALSSALYVKAAEMAGKLLAAEAA